MILCVFKNEEWEEWRIEHNILPNISDLIVISIDEMLRIKSSSVLSIGGLNSFLIHFIIAIFFAVLNINR